MTQKALCPMCDRNAPVERFKPFCSKRCADLDLSQWLSDGYVITGGPADQSEEAPSTHRIRPETEFEG